MNPTTASLITSCSISACQKQDYSTNKLPLATELSLVYCVVEQHSGSYFLLWFTGIDNIHPQIPTGATVTSFSEPIKQLEIFMMGKPLLYCVYWGSIMDKYIEVMRKGQLYSLSKIKKKFLITNMCLTSVNLPSV